MRRCLEREAAAFRNGSVRGTGAQLSRKTTRRGAAKRGQKTAPVQKRPARKQDKSVFPQRATVLRRIGIWLTTRMAFRPRVSPSVLLHGVAGFCAIAAILGLGGAPKIFALFSDPGVTQALHSASPGDEREPGALETCQTGGKAGELEAWSENHGPKPGRSAARPAPCETAASWPARNRASRTAHAAWPAANAERGVASASRPGGDGERLVRKPILRCGEDALGPGREIPVDATGGPRYGMIQFKDTLPLNDGEVIFTFDDGPHPKRTPQILDILDRYCVKAVFFMIGEMAQRSPELVREIDRRGHIVATHTWSHPVSLNFVSEKRAGEQIEQGIAAVADALGRPPAPFFRFPGLGQSETLLEFLAERDIAAWSVDAIAGDSEGVSARRMPGRLMSRLKKYGRGILLFHDIKRSTVQALPDIMEELREDGYRAARVVSKGPVLKVPELTATVKKHRRGGRQAEHDHGSGKRRYR